MLACGDLLQEEGSLWFGVLVSAAIGDPSWCHVEHWEKMKERRRREVIRAVESSVLYHIMRQDVWQSFPPWNYGVRELRQRVDGLRRAYRLVERASPD